MSKPTIKESRDVERAAREHLRDRLRSMSPYGDVECLERQDEQKSLGDFIIYPDETGVWKSVELKAEQSDKYGNLFLESYSNKKWNTPGWMRYCRANILLYYFVEQRQLYECNLSELQVWAFSRSGGVERVSQFKESPQSKFSQKNDTWGWTVPIATLRREVSGFAGPYSIN